MANATHPHFADRLILALRALGHPLCAGLDPHLAQIPSLFRQGNMKPGDPQTADAIEAFLLAFLDRLDGRVAIVKPQIAFFECLGWRGLRTLENVVRKARGAGLLVLLDAKRNDIGSTAAGYAQAYLSADAPLPADAITLSPYLGRDSLEPFAQQAEAQGHGLFVLVKTSNPGSGDFQNQQLADGAPLYRTVATALAPAAARWRGPETGFSSLGAVVGATYPEEHEKVREALPHSIFLVPGYGAQGGHAADAVRGFVAGPGGTLEGGLVNSSRGLLFPPGSMEADTPTWERLIDQAVDRAIDELSTAVAS